MGMGPAKAVKSEVKVEKVEKRPAAAPIQEDKESLSAVLNALKYKADPEKNKKGDVTAAQQALEVNTNFVFLILLNRLICQEDACYFV